MPPIPYTVDGNPYLVQLVKGVISKLNNIYNLKLFLGRIAATMFTLRNEIKEKTEGLFLS